MVTKLGKSMDAQIVSTAHPVVLASASPRRSAILRELAIQFEVVPADLDESKFQGVDPKQLALQLAESKAERVSRLKSDCCVIAADTVVAFEGRSLGKPEDANEAIAMLELLSGTTHEVHTGLAVRINGTVLSGVETTEVAMRNLESSEIEAYVASGAALDKAGAYGIQDANFSPVDSYRGSYSNVVGLPVALLARLLNESREIDSETASLMGRGDAQ